MMVISNIVIGTGCSCAGVVIGLLIRPWFSRHDIILANKEKDSKGKDKQLKEKESEDQENWDNV